MTSTATPRTTGTRFSEIRAARSGASYTDQFVGRSATYTTWDGETLTGTVEKFVSDRPVIRFENGQWAYGDPINIEGVESVRDLFGLTRTQTGLVTGAEARRA